MQLDLNIPPHFTFLLPTRAGGALAHLVLTSPACLMFAVERHVDDIMWRISPQKLAVVVGVLDLY